MSEYIFHILLADYPFLPGIGIYMVLLQDGQFFHYALSLRFRTYNSYLPIIY